MKMIRGHQEVMLLMMSWPPLAWIGSNLIEITRWRNLACPSYETELIIDLYLTKTSVGSFFHMRAQFRVKWI